MTDPTPYTDDDVRRLVALIDEGHYHDSAIHPGSMARHLLAAGVTLPPEPDTPAVPQERYSVEESPNAAPRRRWWVLAASPSSDVVIATTDNSGNADRIASLLNLDAKYEDQGGVAALERSLHEARMAATTADNARVDAETELGMARAEVERLTAELAETRKYADAAQSAVGITPEDEVMGHWFHEQERTRRAIFPVPQDDGPTEPLFTGRMCFTAPEWPDVTVTIDGPHEGWAGQEVAVFPLGAGPTTNQPVTAEMVKRVMAETKLGPGGAYEKSLADALNVQLGRTPAPQPTRDGE